MKKVTKHRVKKVIREKGTWKGMLIPSNCYPGGFWVKGFSVELTQESLERTINEFEYYNCNSELGYYTHFYEN